MSEHPPGPADHARLGTLSEHETATTSPPQLTGFPSNFWERATRAGRVGKQPISLRVDVDVLHWFKSQGPRYQSRMNAVLRSYMAQRREA